MRSLKGMVRELAGAGIKLRYMDIGGGLGITYKDEDPPRPEEYARAVEAELKGTRLTLVLEPGRVIVGNAGIFVTKLLYVKDAPDKTFYIVDGAMNDLVRPAFYDAYQRSARGADERQNAEGRHGGAGLRIGRFLRQRKKSRGDGAGLAYCNHGRRRLWFLHVFELQFETESCRGAREGAKSFSLSGKERNMGTW